MMVAKSNNRNISSLCYLDILRFIACITISIFHTLPYLTDQQINSVPILKIIKNYGLMFVEMFFIISGMLFFLHYYKKLNDSSTSFFNFFKNRIIRIYPLMTVTTLLCFLVVVINSLISKQSLINFSDLAVTLIFGGPVLFTGHNDNGLNGVTWYISVLFFCYLVACFIIAITKKCKSSKKIFIFIVPLMLGACMQVANITSPFFSMAIGRGLFSFFLGIFLMKFLLFMNKIERKKIYLIKILAFVVLSVFVGLKTQAALNEGNRSMPFSIFFFTPILIILYDVKFVNRACSSKIIKFCGAISFNIYLLNGLFARIDACTLACCSFSCRSLSYYSILVALSFEIVLGIVTYFLINKKFTKYLIRKNEE